MPDPRGLPTPSYVAPTPPPTPPPTPITEPTLTPTPATQAIAPPAAPAPMPGMPAKARTQEMPVPEEEPRPLSQWEFLGAKWTVDPTTAYQEYFNSGSSDRGRWDEEYNDYITQFAGGEPLAEGAAGGAASVFSAGEERMLTDLTNAISVGQMDEDQAWKQLENYWSGQAVETRKAEEAGVRGRAMMAGAFPGETLPMTGPGGMGAKLKEQYGLPDLTPAVKGLPMGDVSGIFGQAQTQMGLPETLPPTSPPNIQLPNWGALGQTVPQFGGRNFFDELLREGRSTGF